MKKDGVPERGDVVWLSLTPQARREQAGGRPAVVLSPHTYNRKTGLALVCPVTSKVKGYPFETVLPSGLPFWGAVLCDQCAQSRLAGEEGGVPLLSACRDDGGNHRDTDGADQPGGVSTASDCWFATRSGRRDGLIVSLCPLAACLEGRTDATGAADAVMENGAGQSAARVDGEHGRLGERPAKLGVRATAKSADLRFGTFPPLCAISFLKGHRPMGHRGWGKSRWRASGVRGEADSGTSAPPAALRSALLIF